MSIQTFHTLGRNRPALAELLGEAFTLAYTWRERRQQRQALLRLDDRMLLDIGLSRSDVEREASKPFWRC